MGQLVILIVVALVAAALAWGVAVLLLGRDPGLEPAEPDGRSIPLPTARPLTEADLGLLRFDTAVRGYRMFQVDQALRRAAYDIGYKEELIGVLEAEVAALRDGRFDEAETLRRAREAAQQPRTAPVTGSEPDDAVDTDAIDGDMPAEAAAAPDPETPDEETADEETPDAEAPDGETLITEAPTQAPAEAPAEAPTVAGAVEDWVSSGVRSPASPEEQPADGDK